MNKEEKPKLFIVCKDSECLKEAKPFLINGKEHFFCCENGLNKVKDKYTEYINNK